jgi:hypothetical protein
MKGLGRWIALVVGLALAGYGLWHLAWGGGDSGDAPRRTVARVKRIVPESDRIRVEVLNGTGTRGLARLGTGLLRDLGFDVVSSGNASERVDSTTVLVRSGRMDWGQLAAKGLGGARVEARPDTSRYLDLTILLGPDWRPPPEPFDP